MISFNAEVMVWFDVGCSCSYDVSEQSGSLEVCAQILFINGTELTISDYTVTISADTTSASAQSEIMKSLLFWSHPLC